MIELEDNEFDLELELENDTLELNAELDYRGPRGPQGEKGEKGEKGETGDTGPQGIPGPSGVFVGESEPQDPNFNIWINPREKTENYVRKEQFDYMIPKNKIAGLDNTFEDGLDMPLFDLRGDGKSEQVVTTGKNLYDGVNQNYYLNNGVNLCGYAAENSGLAINVSQYSQLTVSTQSIQERYRVGCVNSLPTGAGSMEVPVFNGVKKDGTNDSITVDTTDYNYLIINATNLSVIQVEEGSVATEYEPYTGGQPSPSPDYPQEINSIEGSLEFVSRGKNLIKYSTEKKSHNGLTVVADEAGIISVSGTASANYGTYNYFDLSNIPIGNYTISVDKLRSFQIRLKVLFEDNSIINYDIGKFQIEVKINTNKRVKSIQFNLINLIPGTTYNEKIFLQLERGSKTSYEPYKEPNRVTFNLGKEVLRSVGDVKDELVVDLDTGDFYKIEKIGERIFDGKENWKFEVSEENYTQFAIYNFSTNSFIRTPILNNFFSDTDSSGLIISRTTLYLKFPKSSIVDVSNLDKLKSWLQEHNIIGQYQLPTPITKKLGTLLPDDLAKLRTFEGYNNVKINTNLGLMNIRLTYGLDIKKYVDNKIAELSARKEVV